jgi:hypothetical protein
MLLGGVLAAPATWPFVESLRASATWPDRQGAGAWAISSEAYALFWDPFALGSPLPGSAKPWRGVDNFEEAQQYVGILP